MPLDGDSKFKELKKAYAKGVELRGKTLGIIGFGRIGQATARIALGCGMKVIASDPFIDTKQGAGIVNAARGGVIDEVALLDALDQNKLSFAALDVFENEPKPAIKVLMHPKVSLTPHIGAATGEAQDRIGTELAEQIITLL